MNILGFIITHADDLLAWLTKHRWAVYMLLLFAAGVYVGYVWATPEPVEPEVKYVDRYYPVISSHTVPDREIKYKPLIPEETIKRLKDANDSLKAAIAAREPRIVDTLVLAPTGLTRFNLVPVDPVRVEGNKAVLTFYDTAEYRYKEQVYEIEKKWHYNLEAALLYAPFTRDLVPEIEASLGYKRWAVKARTGYFLRPYLMGGIAYSIID